MTLVDVLRRRAAEDPDHDGYVFLADGEHESARLSWSRVDLRARAIAAALQDGGGAGERALITYPAEDGPQFLTSFLGCLYAGVVAVPCDAAQGRAGAERLGWIASDAAPRFVLGPAEAGHLAAVGDGVRALDVGEIPDGAADGWREPAMTADGLALLQYTSGSTGNPRGVMVTHGNVMANENAIRATCEHDVDSSFVGWLPLYHDMGLIANLLQPLYLGSCSILMPPAAFLARPMRWLAAISRYRAVTSGGPNFAYDLCAARVQPSDYEGLDLSSWRVAFNGAEVVRAATLHRFYAAFAQAGLSPTTFFPCYGLAEATLIVSGAPRGVLPRTFTADRAALRSGRCVPPASEDVPSRTLVSSGRPVVDTRVLIASPETGLGLPDGALGEVWISGPGIAVGYWGRPEDTAATFGNVVDGRRYLRTGDVGAMLDGELYVVARLKDMIIIRGQNHYPEDLEHTAERASRLLRPSCGAAFSIDSELGEQLVVLYEADTRSGEPDVEAIAAAVRQAVSERHRIEVHGVVLVARGSVPKTTSGKVRRLACRDRYLAGSLPVVGSSVLPSVRPELPAAEDVEALASALAAAVTARTGVPVDADTPLGAAGLDSLAAVELAHSLQDRYGVQLTAPALLGDATVAGLAALLCSDSGSASPGADGQRCVSAIRAKGPLAPMQRALWFEHQVAPVGPAYALVRALRLDGELDADALDRAVARLAARHEALRTRFEERDGEPVQVVVPEGPVLRREELGTADEAAVAARLAAEAARPFALRDAGPPVRLTLLRLGTDAGAGSHLLVIAAHHIAADFWSLVVVIRELLALYGEEAGGPPAGLPPVRGTLIGHALIEDAWREHAGAESSGYWEERLAGVPAALDLPLDRPRPAVRGFRGGGAAVRCDAGLTARLRDLARAHRTTPFTVALAAYQVLLAQHCGQRDLVVGTLASGRDRAELANAVGCFVNVVPVRARLRARDTFGTLLDRVRGELLADLAHARYPFAQLVSRLQPARVPGRPPLVQALLVWQQEYGQRDDGLRAAGLGVDGPPIDGGLRARSVAVEQPWTHLDLTLNLAEVGGELRGGFEYDAALFEPSTAAALARRFESLLHALVGDPDRPLAEVPPVAGHELDAALAAGRGPVRQRTPSDTLHGLVLDAARRTPDAVAVVLPDAGGATGQAGDGRARSIVGGVTGQLSYRALEERSRALAGGLAAAGVGPGDVVGVLLPRSLALPVALLAVLRRGAAYLPLDPDDPPGRIEWLLRDAGATALITDGRAARGGVVSIEPGGVAVASGIAVIGVDAVASIVDADAGGRARDGGSASALAADAGVHPEQAAYVIYTSGSTGRPKGVVVPHRGIVNRLLWMQEELGLDAGDRVVHKAPTTFDVSLWELFWPLVRGACLVLAPPGAHRDPGGLRALFEREDVGTAHFVPSLLSAFLGAAVPGAGGGGLPALRRVVCSGEALPAALRDRVLRELPGARLHNLYGPTETSVDVTAWECAPGETGPVPIGRPIANTDAHVLDPMLRPLPSRVRGELCIGGAGLAHGYLGRPGLTAAAFVPDPHGSTGARLYRTGDQARRRPDGVIEYLGRTDHQVKIAGVRVELGEIEDALRSLPGVRDAAAIVRDDGGSGPVLVGYVAGERARIGPASDGPASDGPASDGPASNGPASNGSASGGAELDGNVLVAALRERLPAALVPATVVVLDELPTTGSGKLDRSALPAPVVGREPLSVEPLGVEPLGGVERRIALVWSEALGVSRVGADDDFFALGGDSIRALRLVALLRDAGVEVSVAQLLAAGTVRGLARACTGDDGAGATPQPRPFELCPDGLRPALPADVVDAYPVSMAQRAVLFHQLGDSNHEVYVTSVHVRSVFDEPAMRAALGAVLDRHPYLRSRFDLTSEREPQQLVVDGMPPPLTVHEWHGEAELTQWLRAERRRAFDVTRGPLVRCAVHARSATEFQLTIGSFALDGWCTATVITELLTDYAAMRAGRPSPLRPPAVGYASFVALERAAVRSPEQRAFWSDELSGAVACRLPQRHTPAPAAGGERLSRRHLVNVDDGVTAELRRIARNLSVPLKSVLLAAHLRVVRLLSARDAVITGLEVNGRPESRDGDRIVGVFNNIVPLRVAASGGSWADLARSALAAERRVLPYRRYPLAQLEREHDAGALFDTLFVYTHFHVYDQVRDVEGVELLGWEAPDQTYVPLTAHFNVDAITGELHLMLDHDPARVSDELAAEAAGYYLRALSRLAADPDAPHAHADLLTPDQLRHQLTPPAAGASTAGTVHGLILRQAAATPDAVAVSAGGAQLSYRALAARSAVLASALRAAGVAPDDLVALPARRDLDLVVGLLGILRAGAAYLPVDADHPTERLRATLANARALVAAPDLAASLPVPPSCTVLPPSPAPSSAPALSSTPAAPAAGALPMVPAGALAYALHTSGTSGAPKIVGVPHAAVCNYLAWCARAYGPLGGRRTPVQSSVTFDLTVTSLLAPLCSGGTVELVDDVGAALTSGADGLVKITPAHLEAVGRQLDGSRTAVGCVVVGGEQLRRHHLAPWGGLPLVVNEYGPTEATVGCIVHRVHGDDEDPVPIGRPITGTRAHVLHGGLPVPVGTAAELHIGGAGLARGYLGRPGLTAERFVPDPFGFGERLYRTGDLARLGEDGELRFVGRTDRQLKLRGFRVEPSEIEDELRRHPLVRHAAVVAAPAGNGRPRLLAYWVPREGLGVGADADSPLLAAWLAQRLPAHLVPAQVHRLPALPLTPNGKVDHAGLADPAHARREALRLLVAGLTDDAATELLALARTGAHPA